MALTIKLSQRIKAVHAVARLSGPPTPAAGANVDAALQNRLLELQGQLEQERTKLHHARKALQEGLAKVQLLRAEMLQEAEEQLLDLAIEIARKVLMQEVQAQRYQIDPIVREALLHVPARQDVLVHLHPEDLAVCSIAQEAQQNSSAGTVRFVADPAVLRAECLLETKEGAIESSMEMHLEQIRDVLKEGQ